MSNQYLSFSDLRLLDDWNEEEAEQIDDLILPFKLKFLLWKNGVNINKPITCRWCYHRNLQNRVVYDKRIDFFERTDKPWLKSGASSLEAFIDSCDDKSMQNDLKRMQREGFSYEQYVAIIAEAERQELITEPEEETITDESD